MINKTFFIELKESAFTHEDYIYVIFYQYYNVSQEVKLCISQSNASNPYTHLLACNGIEILQI